MYSAALRAGKQVFLLTVAIGCHSTQNGAAKSAAITPPPGYVAAPRSLSIAASPERIWAALPKAYKSVGITVNAADTTTRSMGFAGMIRHELGGTRLSKFFSCGSQIGENADSYDINLFVASQVASDPQTRRILVTTGLRVSARSPAFAGTTTVCTSTGELERRIMTALQAEVRR